MFTHLEDGEASKDARVGTFLPEPLISGIDQP